MPEDMPTITVPDCLRLADEALQKARSEWHTGASSLVAVADGYMRLAHTVAELTEAIDA